MYPTNLYGNPHRPFQLFGRDGFLRNIPPVMPGVGLNEAHALGWNLRQTLQNLRVFCQSILPDDCPVVIGGGFVRDGLLGGRISDIDVWLPSNIRLPRFLEALQGEVHSSDFITYANQYLGGNTAIQSTTLFEAPFATLDAAQDGTAYHDMSNHWVVSTYPNNYPIQFMRTNIPYEGDPSAFMNGVMRNFDIDLCMMFLCFEQFTRNQYGGFDPAENNVDTVLSSQYIVMPEHLVENMNSGLITRMGWNTARNTTSDARRSNRFLKMTTKYNLIAASPLRQFNEIQPEDIRAIPVPVGFLMDRLHNLPLPIDPRTNNIYGSETGSLFQAQIQGTIGDPVRLGTGAVDPYIVAGTGVSPASSTLPNTTSLQAGLPQG